MDQPNRHPVRTLLISDVHLGCKHSQSREFLCFLRSYSPDVLYIVGDFIDAWKINTGWHWPRECDEIVDHLMAMSQSGTKIFYVPGNHDAFMRNPAFRALFPAKILDVEVANEFVFETLGGWRFLVTHGDLFDFFETRAQWISKGTSGLYDFCLSLNWWFHRAMLRPHHNPYGVCAALKERVKRWVKFISHYESEIMKHARVRCCEGVICGHIHTPDIVRSDSLLYCNTGDWVENCTGLVEQHDGTIDLVSRYCDGQQLKLPPRGGRIENSDLLQEASDDEPFEFSAATSQPNRAAKEFAA